MYAYESFPFSLSSPVTFQNFIDMQVVPDASNHVSC